MSTVSIELTSSEAHENLSNTTQGYVISHAKFNGTVPNYDVEFLYACGIYANFVRSMGVITVFMFPLMVFLLVWITPPEMKVYKWFLMNNVVTGFLHVLLLGIWTPVPIFFDGIICAFSLGPSRIDSMWNYLMLQVSILLFLNLSLSYVASLIYQYSLVMPTTMLGSLPKSPLRFFTFYIVYSIFINTTLIFFGNFNHEDTRTIFHRLYEEPIWTNASDLLKNIYWYEKSMIAFSYETNLIIMVFGIVLFLAIFFETLAIFGLNFKIFNSIRNMNTKLHGRVQSLQQMLYRLICQKTFVLILFFFIPFLVLFLCILSVVKSFYVGMAAFALMSLYAPCSYVLIIYNVKPYREWIEGLIGRGSRKRSDSTISYVTMFSASSKKMG